MISCLLESGSVTAEGIAKLASEYGHDQEWVVSRRGSLMKADRIMKKQAEWQKARKDLPWAKKIRLIEQVRDSWEQLNRLRRRVRRPDNI